MTAEEFRQHVIDKDPTNWLPNGTDSREAIHILCEHFLGEDFRIDGYPASPEQVNSEIVYEILKRYPKGKIRKIGKTKRIWRSKDGRTIQISISI